MLPARSANLAVALNIDASTVPGMPIVASGRSASMGQHNHLVRMGCMGRERLETLKPLKPFKNPGANPF
jgi:hypothetical protein